MIVTEKYDIGLADQLLDQGVTSKNQEDINKNYRLHLHCWHGNDPFSKFDFKAGKYDQIQPSSLISDTSAYGLVNNKKSNCFFFVVKSSFSIFRQCD